MKVKIGDKPEIPTPDTVDASAIINQQSAHNMSANLARELKKSAEIPDLSVSDLEGILRKQFPPKEINRLLLDMTNAEDTKATSQGDYYTTPNWDARDKALTKILRLLGHIKNEQGVVSDQAPTKIIFNVIHRQVNVQNAEINHDSTD